MIKIAGKYYQISRYLFINHIDMYLKKTVVKLPIAGNLPKNQKKYVPTPEQATTIINYFLHNNFQDFNTWQQISRSKCQFEYSESKIQNFQCKVTLKWDDSSLPIIVQIGKSRNKKNAKKKALHKLIQNLIFLGYIGYGFKDSDFIKKLPKRRKQSSDDQSLVQSFYCDQMVFSLLSSRKMEDALDVVNCKNFQKMLCLAIKERNLVLVVRILRKLQNNFHQATVSDFDVRVNQNDLEEEKWQNYQQTQLRDLFKDDLADILRFYQQFQLPQSHNENKEQEYNIFNLHLPCQSISSSQGKISFQFFHPIEYSLIFRRNIQKSGGQKEKRDKSEYFQDFYKQIPIPIFESENLMTPLSYKVIQRILSIFMEFSYDYNLVVTLLSIFERQVTSCNFGWSIEQESEKFYLRQMVLITAQFAYLVSKKIKLSTNFIEGLINYESDGYLTFIPKEPQEILVQKISKKINTNEIQQMQEFANEEIILLVSKIDPKIMYIAQILQCWPTIRLRSTTFQAESDPQKLPYTMFKLANSKLYNRLVKSIGHTIKNKFSQLKNNAFIFFQRPTQPLLTLIYQILAEWIALNQTVLLVSQNYNEIFLRLMEKGFKVAKIGPKAEEKNVIKKQIICCNPSSVCADVIKNYAFTRVIIQGAQRVSQALSTLALDKGAKKLYLIGDPKLPHAIVLSKFAKNRDMSRSLFDSLIKQQGQIYNFSQFSQQNFFESSILQILNKNYYSDQLNKYCIIQSPYVKGFPWPSDMQRLTFIQIREKQSKKILNKSVQLCCEIVANIIQAGFITISEIGCRVTTTYGRGVLTSNLYNMLRKYSYLGVNCQLSSKCVQFITGSRFKQKSVCILIAQPHQLNIKHLIAALQESRRGLIVIGDFREVKHEAEWRSILKYAYQKRVIMQAFI